MLSEALSLLDKLHWVLANKAQTRKMLKDMPKALYVCRAR